MNSIALNFPSRLVMKRCGYFLVCSLVCLVFENLTALDSPEKKMGRLTGWGLLGDGVTLESTLPTGWDAENIIQVSAGQRDWAALSSDGKVITGGFDNWVKEQPPRWVGRCKSISMGAGFCMGIRSDGTLAVWGKYADQLGKEHEELENVVEISAGYLHGSAITADGEFYMWSPRYDPSTESGKRLVPILERVRPMLSDVTDVCTAHGSVIVLREDGIAVRWSYERPDEGIIEISNLPEQPPIRRIDSRGFRLVAVDVEGKIRNTADDNFEIPSDIGRVDFVRTGRDYGLARLENGKVKVWGVQAVPIDFPPEELEMLYDFDVGFSHNVDSNFVIGIAPSYLSGFAAFEPEAPELKSALAALETERLAADDELVAFEDRYLEELRKLEAAAAKNDRPKIAASIKVEIANFRDRSRPAFESPERLVTLQKIYREGAHDREEERDAKTFAVYKNAVGQLQELQDSLTQGKKLQAAVETRTYKDKISATLELLKNPPAPATDLRQTFDPIPEDKKIFSVDDERVEGQLITIGNIDGLPPKFEESDGRRVTWVSAAGKIWVALRADGTYFGQNSKQPVTHHRNLPKFSKVFADSIVFGLDQRGDYVAQNPGGSDTPPEPWDEIVDIKISGTQPSHCLALYEDGSVNAWGEYYRRANLKWAIPPEVAAVRDASQIAVSRYAASVLRGDGTILWWNETGLLDSPPDATDLIQIDAGPQSFIGLKRDGTVAVWSSQPAVALFHDVPHSLTDVVEVVAGSWLLLALRADGKWICWGDAPRNLLDQVHLLDGVRWLDVGGYGRSEVYFVGIKPDPEDLEK